MLLFTLVMEKEEGIRELLVINGLKIKKYWFVYILYYFIFLNIISVCFVLLGWVMIDLSYFKNTSLLVQIVMLVCWNSCQISWALLASTALKSSRAANIIGYLSSIFLVLIISGISFSMFPVPLSMPLAFYLLPQTGMIRSFYLMNYACSTGKCVTGFDNMPSEIWTSIISMLVLAVVYGGIGLIVNEPSVQK